MPDPVAPQLDELRRRARRRLVGAVVLALAAAVLVPMLLESDPKPLGEDVSVKIPPVDDGKFVNKLADHGKTSETAKVPAPKIETPASAAPASASAASQGTDPPKESAPAPSSSSSAKSVAQAEQRVLGTGNAKLPAKDPASASPPEKAESATPAKSTADAKRAESTAPKAAAGESTKAAATIEPPKTTAASAEPQKASPKPASAEPSKAPASSAEPSKVAADGFSVQLAAFADDKGANALAGKLKKAGHPAYTEPYATSRGTLWRVRVGPYPSRDAAEAARTKLKAEGQNGIIAAAR